MSLKSCVVTIHGVGDSAPGSTLSGLAERLSDSKPDLYRQCETRIGELEYVTLSTRTSRLPDIYEVNWADVEKPLKSWQSIVTYVIRLIFACLHISEKWPSENAGRPRLLWLNRFFFELLTFWSLPAAAYAMLLYSYTGNSRLLVAVVGPIVVAIVTYYVHKWSKVLLAGGVIFVLCYAWMGYVAVRLPERLPNLVEQCSASYIRGHMIAPIWFLALILFILLPVWNGLTLEQRLARLLFGYVPFLGITLVGAGFWAFAAQSVAEQDRFEDWSAIHERVLATWHYDLQLVELTHLALLAVLAAMIFAAAGLYAYRRKWSSERRKQAGIGVRNALGWIPWLIPVITSVLGIIMYYDYLTGREAEATTVLDVYRISAARLLFFLPWLLPVARIILDILGDVAYVALPDDDGMSVRKNVRQRIDTLLNELTEAGYERIVILSHSLGTVLAAASACHLENSRIRLITTGSPISCLHGRFLGWKLEEQPDFKKWPVWWENLFNYGDYIGGEIKLESSIVKNIPLKDTPPERDGHVGYWTESAVLDSVGRALEAEIAPRE